MNNRQTLSEMEKNAYLDSYRKSKLERDKLITRFALDLFGDFDVLDYPVCPHCEGLATYDINDSIYCERCGRSSAKGVLTLREYIDREIMKGGKRK